MVGSRVYVGGLPYGVRERDLERFFKGYGRTRDILIKNGYGFVVSTKQYICIGMCSKKKKKKRYQTTILGAKLSHQAKPFLMRIF